MLRVEHSSSQVSSEDLKKNSAIENEGHMRMEKKGLSGRKQDQKDSTRVNQFPPVFYTRLELIKHVYDLCYRHRLS